jgi:hypothetical protein
MAVTLSATGAGALADLMLALPTRREGCHKSGQARRPLGASRLS